MLGVNGDFTGLNLYAYCGNNPISRKDIGGYFWDIVFDIGSLALSIADVVANPTDPWAWAGVVGDALDLIPVVTGLSETVKAIKATKTIDNVVDVADDLYDTAKVVDNIGDTVSDASRSLNKIDICDCFVAGTLILTDYGTIAIENIRTGDYVWASDPETGEVALKKVVRTFVNEATELVHVEVDGEEIVCTEEHPFYSPVNGWIEACDLRAGDILVTVRGEYVVVEKVQQEILESPVKIYNFEVEDFHTYYVTDTGVLVHNSCTIVKENGVKIVSNYPYDHGNPAHLHVIGGGPTTKIGPQGLPVKGFPPLTPKQATVVANNLPKIKKEIKAIQKMLREME